MASWWRMLCLGCIFGLFLLASPSSAEWKGSVNAEARLEAFQWTSGPLGPDGRLLRPVAQLKVPASIRNGRSLRLRFLPLLQLDERSPSRSERFYWDPQEAYLQLQLLPWTIQAGYNVQTWGDTDVFNPLDVVNARRYWDPFRSEKIGAPTLLVKREWEKLIVEALYIPWQRETLVPGEESRWLPRDIYRSRKFDGLELPGIGTLSGTIQLPADLRYHYLPAHRLGNALRDNYGGRVKFRFSGFDWTLAGFHGAAPAPSVNVDTIGLSSYLRAGASSVNIAVNPDVYLRALFYRTRMLGTSFVWVLGDFLVKGASAQTKVVSGYIDGLLPKDMWENVLGLERSFPLGKGTLTALAQGTYVSRNEKLDTNSVSLSRLFDRAAMAGLRWAPNERLTALFSYLRDLHYSGDLVHSELSYKLADGFLGRLAGDLLGGRPETPIGTYRLNDRVTAGLQLSF